MFKIQVVEPDKIEGLPRDEPNRNKILNFGIEGNNNNEDNEDYKYYLEEENNSFLDTKREEKEL